MTRAAIAIAHDPDEGLALLAPELERAGFAIAHRFREVRAGDADAALVVVLGGPMSAYDDDASPFLAAELALLRQRLARGQPTLGICLGAQLLARAAGATVSAGVAGFELPASVVALTADGERDPMFAGVARELAVPQWHADTFTAVPGAVHLATSGAYAQQGFRIGAAAYGVQFHLELDAELLASWCARLPADVARAGRSAAEIAAAVASIRAGERALQRLRANIADELAAATARYPTPASRR